MKIAKLDICVTLRCNAYCKNCLRFCNLKDITGLDYSDSDMTMGQIDHFIDQMRALKGQFMLRSLNLSGGEPLLHPQIVEIVERLEVLRREGLVRSLTVNSNEVVTAPECLKTYIINYVKLKNRSRRHQVVLLHPGYFKVKKTYNECDHYRKSTWVLTYQGYSLCCAADGYIRLFGMDDLLFDHLPVEVSSEMDKVCQHCPFSVGERLPYEIEVGRPTSEIYLKEAEKNRQGRKIKGRFPERLLC